MISQQEASAAEKFVDLGGGLIDILADLSYSWLETNFLLDLDWGLPGCFMCLRSTKGY